MKPIEYYSDSALQRKLYDIVKSKPVMTVNDYSGAHVVRRNDDTGSPIAATSPKDFQEWARKHMVEVHGVHGKTTKELIVDLDPGKDVSWDETKKLTQVVADKMKSLDGVNNVGVQFSGGRGFYVRGYLDTRRLIDNARKSLQEALGDVIEQQELATLHKPKDKQVRLDTSTLHNKGSVRAPYSLNADTGLVSAPLELSQLLAAKREDFSPKKILQSLEEKTSEDNTVRLVRMVIDALKPKHVPPLPKHKKPKKQHKAKLGAWGSEEANRLFSVLDDVPLLLSNALKRRAAQQAALGDTAALSEPIDDRTKSTAQKEFHYPQEYGRKIGSAEFAPGIPASRKTLKIPSVKSPAQWDLAVQLHEAEKAGKHWDLRLVDPKGHAHSFAIPKSRFPDVHDKMLLALQQATHSKNYALNFEGTIPKGTYGAGKVTMPIKEKVTVLKSSDNGIKFERPNGDAFAMFRTNGDKWGIKKTGGIARVFLDRLLGRNVTGVFNKHYQDIINRPVVARQAKRYSTDGSTFNSYVERILRGNKKNVLGIGDLPAAGRRTRVRQDLVRALQRGQRAVEVERMSTLKARLGLGGAVAFPAIGAGSLALSRPDTDKSAAAQDDKVNLGLAAAAGAVGVAPVAQGIASGALRFPAPKHVITDLQKLRKKLRLGDILLTGDTDITPVKGAISAFGGDPFGYHVQTVTGLPIDQRKVESIHSIGRRVGGGAAKRWRETLGDADLIIKRFKNPKHVKRYLANLKKVEDNEHMLRALLGQKALDTQFDVPGAVKSGLKDILPTPIRRLLPSYKPAPGRQFCSNLAGMASPVPLCPSGVPRSETLPHHIQKSPALKTVGHYRMPRTTGARVAEGLLQASPWLLRGAVGAALGYGTYRGLNALTEKKRP